MGSFKRALLGYRRGEVDAAIVAREARIERLQGEAAAAAKRASAVERECVALSQMVLDREREIRGLREHLREANERHERSIASLEAVAARLDEVHAQARGQATRIRMKALREAVEVSRRAEALRGEGDGAGAGNGRRPAEPEGLFEGLVRVEIGPLGDFSQLVGFEDALGGLGATSEISVERFSEGRATLSMRLDEPVELLRELEERSPLEFRVRRAAGDNLILDVDDEDRGGERRAA